MKTGLDNLLQRPQFIHNRHIGIVTNPTGITSNLLPTADVINSIPVARVRALFGPEHGINSATQDAIAVDSRKDAVSELPIYSLYGDHKKPTAEMLKDIDLLIYDIQDVGCRFYTYMYTLAYVMQAAAEQNIEVMVLDRPDPINGNTVEGPLLEPSCASFVGLYPIAVRYGLTIAELANLMNTEFGIHCKLSVVKMRGWRREMYYDQTRLPWVTPSPNLPSGECAVVYPGTCLFEGTNLSEGRGTTHPFEWIGAPWLDSARLVKTLNALDLPGVRFRPQSFEPTYSKHKGVICNGVQIHVTHRARISAFETGLHMVAAVMQQHPHEFEFLPTSWEGKPPHFDLLSGSPRIREQLIARVPIHEIKRGWQKELAQFKKLRQKYLLY